MPSGNTILNDQSITITSSTSKLLIMAQWSFTLNFTGTVFGTISRSTDKATLTNSINLANNIDDMSNDINASNSRYMSVVSVQYNVPSSMNMSVIDTPNSAGTYYYTIWWYADSGDNIPVVENVMLTVLQIQP